MAYSQVRPASDLFQVEVRRRVSARFLFWLGLLLGLSLLLSDNQIQRGFGTADDSYQDQVEGQISQNQGNAVRQLGYTVVCLAGILCYRRMRPARPAWRVPLAPICGALLGWCVLSIAWSDDPATSGKRLLGFLFVAVGAAGVSFVWSRSEIAQFLSLYGFVQITLGFGNELLYHAFTPWIGAYRFAGTQHENVQAICCVLALLASLAAADMVPMRRGFFRFLAAYAGLFLVLTKSRSSLLGIVVGLTLYVLLTRPSRNIGWLAGGLSLTTFVLYMSGILDPLLGFVSRDGEGLSDFTGRKPVWTLADEFIQRQPLTGYGFQAFWSGDRIDYFSGSFGWQISSAHNGFLETLLTLGYVGMLLHGLVLGLAILFGILLFRRTGNAFYALAASFFAALLCISEFESAVLVSSGPYSFGVCILLAALCFEPLLPGLEREAPLLSRLRPRGRGLPDSLVKV